MGGEVEGNLGSELQHERSREAERLAALRHYDILDTAPEAEFDDLTRLASQLCATPIALISLIDAERQWFKSKVGLSVSETPRDISFCAHAIQQQGVFEVPDALVDERFRDSPLVVEHPHVRFYAGAPLVTPQGHTIGTLCVKDHVPHRLTDEQRSGLAALGRQVVRQLELRGALRRHQRLEGELRGLNENLERLVTERTAALAASERRFMDLFESAPDAIVIATREGTITLVNRQVERLFGWPRGELIGKAFEMLMPPEDRAGHAADREGSLAHAVPRAMGAGRSDLRGLRKDGTTFPVEVSLSPLESQGERLVAAAVRDISQRVQLEAQFLQAQKMESVGQLAGGVAHDFNNLITVINSTAELAAAGLATQDPAQEDLRTIRDAGARAAALTRQLLAFSRKQFLKPAFVNLNAVVANVQTMLQRVIGEHIALTVRLGERLGTVKVDPGQIDQVILNLAINSRDAMPHGGSLTIATGNVELDETYAKAHAGVAPGPYVLLAISDTGSGMDQATLQKIFEPFFSTKAPGQGTGLGLSTAYGIIKQSGGDIWAYSEVGKGTTIKVYLPRVSEAPPEERPVTPGDAARGTETILVVEDETALRLVARRILSAAGYTVLVAACGEEALEMLERSEQPVHLLLTDVVMPGMSGGELGKRLRWSHPYLRILYTSGYTGDVVLHHQVLDRHDHFLGKPYSIAELTGKVREMLDSR